MTGKDFDLTQWLEEISDKYEVRLSVREGKEWVDRKELIDKNIEYYILKADPGEEEIRHYFNSEDVQKVGEWKRYAFTIIGNNREIYSPKPEIDIKIILELPSNCIDIIPWEKMGQVTLSVETLDYVNERDGFKPVKANKIAGLEEQKNRLKRFLGITNEEWGLSDETGIILQGPPGTGKTELVIEICQEMYGSIPVMISGPEILSKWVGESERMLRKKFEEARDGNHRLLYIDELDAIARTRSESSENYSAQIVAQLLVLLDGAKAKQERERNNPLKVIASTNISHVIDPALRRPGRLGSRPVYFEMPCNHERKAILHHYLEKIYCNGKDKLSPDLQNFIVGRDLKLLDEVIDKTEGFTGADLEDLVREAVVQVQENDQSVLDLKILGDTLEEFSLAKGIKSEDFSESELEATLDIPGLDIKTLIFELEDNHINPRDVAKDYFKKLKATKESNEDFKFRYKEVGPRDILEDNPIIAKENVVEAFKHSEDERICLYIKNTENIVKARKYSPLIDRLIGVINEQLLQWDQENLLILDYISETSDRITNMNKESIE
ncbi:ATP-binding protein [Methanococcoides methylutens]|uniref:Cell division protein FtsH n=1 Tax=Methanococcoides methylutens MM1 TaxID=1434104 RepID=A0A0E3WZR1_METMT|nr:ATP-binding protein [Methanococcoides methylutens]AKB84515.1 Cell division protein FtsH [Methanococcoides methylutens MM1]